MPQGGRMSAMCGWRDAFSSPKVSCRMRSFPAWTPAESCGRMPSLVQALDTKKLLQKSEKRMIRKTWILGAATAAFTLSATFNVGAQTESNDGYWRSAPGG